MFSIFNRNSEQKALIAQAPAPINVKNKSFSVLIPSRIYYDSVFSQRFWTPDFKTALDNAQISWQYDFDSQQLVGRTTKRQYAIDGAALVAQQLRVVQESAKSPSSSTAADESKRNSFAPSDSHRQPKPGQQGMGLALAAQVARDAYRRSTTQRSPNGQILVKSPRQSVSMPPVIKRARSTKKNKAVMESRQPQQLKLFADEVLADTQVRQPSKRQSMLMPTPPARGSSTLRGTTYAALPLVRVTDHDEMMAQQESSSDKDVPFEATLRSPVVEATTPEQSEQFTVVEAISETVESPAVVEETFIDIPETKKLEPSSSASPASDKTLFVPNTISGMQSPEQTNTWTSSSPEMKHEKSDPIDSNQDASILAEDASPPRLSLILPPVPLASKCVTYVPICLPMEASQSIVAMKTGAIPDLATSSDGSRARVMYPFASQQREFDSNAVKLPAPLTPVKEEDSQELARGLDKTTTVKMDASTQSSPMDDTKPPLSIKMDASTQYSPVDSFKLPLSMLIDAATQKSPIDRVQPPPPLNKHSTVEVPESKPDLESPVEKVDSKVERDLAFLEAGPVPPRRTSSADAGQHERLEMDVALFVARHLSFE